MFIGILALHRKSETDRGHELELSLAYSDTSSVTIICFISSLTKKSWFTNALHRLPCRYSDRKCNFIKLYLREKFSP
uniref:Uncharacterized protein n=1 Tax=Arundo donax TaxID=35708 RepID=A0A0A9C5I4_ARUDO